MHVIQSSYIICILCHAQVRRSVRISITIYYSGIQGPWQRYSECAWVGDKNEGDAISGSVRILCWVLFRNWFIANVILRIFAFKNIIATKVWTAYAHKLSIKQRHTKRYKLWFICMFIFMDAPHNRLILVSITIEIWMVDQFSVIGCERIRVNMRFKVTWNRCYSAKVTLWG